MNIQKRWDRQYGYATPYWVDLENPVIIFDSYINEFVSYVELSVTDQKLVARAIDEFEGGNNDVIRLGCKFYERFNYQRFSILREIERINESIRLRF